MAGTALLGYLLLAGGPPLVLWCAFVAGKSFLVLLALASTFWWLVTLFVISLLFRAFVPLSEHAAVYGLVLVVAVGVQECARYGAFLAHRAVLGELEAASQHLALPKPTVADSRLMALTQGMGHALAQTLFLYFSWVQLSAGGGTLYLDACPQMSFFLTGGLLSLAFFLLHTFSMVVAFHGWERRSRGTVGAVAGLHLLAALTTLGNMAPGGCVAATSAALAEAGVAVAAAAGICWLWPGEGRGPRLQHRAGQEAGGDGL